MPRHQPRPDHPVGRRLWRALRQTLVAVVSLALVALVPGVPGGGVAFAAVEPHEAREAMRGAMAEFAALRASIDRTAIDVEALAFELAFAEAGEITAFVRDSIAFEAYDGVLRGAQGALVGGSANAMDQALLASTLLTSAGYDVRLGQGRIGRADAERLVASMARTEDLRSAMPDDASFEAFTRSFGLDGSDMGRAAGEGQAILGELQHELEDVTDMLGGRIGVNADAADGVVDALVEATRAYTWVEYGFGGAWEQAHPAFPEGEAPESLDVEGHLDDVVPEELVHRVRVQVFIEQRRGHELIVSPVTDPWERPAVSIYGRAVTLVNMPDGLMDVDDPTDTEAVLEATTFFTPFMQSEFAPGALAFDLNGNSLAPDVAMDQAAGVVRATGGLFGTAAGALAGEADPDDFVTLTAQWIEYTLIEPGGRETTHTRTIVDRVGTERRAAGIVEVDPEVSAADVADAMLRSHTFMVAPGRYADAFVLDAQLASSIASQPLLESIFDAGVELAADAELPEEVAESARSLDLLQLYAAFDAAPIPDDVLAYRAVPSLVVVERAWDGSHAVVDVVQNRKVVLDVAQPGLPRLAPAAARTIGVWETRTEGLPIVRPDAAEWNTFTVFEAAQREGVEIRTLAPGDVEAAARLDLPERSRRAIAADLAAGFAVVTPVSVPDGGRFAGWWRSDPVTGETLGVGDDGRGKGFVEYLLTLNASQQLMAAGLILAGTRTLSSCAAAGSARGYACCVVEGVVITGAFVGLGAALAAGFGIGALGLMIALDLGAGTGLMIASMATDWVPSACNRIAGVCTPMRFG